jgi:hypothetical protein
MECADTSDDLTGWPNVVCTMSITSGDFTSSPGAEPH